VSQLVTGEAVALDLRPAALPSRVLAGLVDAVAQFTLLAVVGGVATAVSLDLSAAAEAALGLVVLALVLVVYPVTFETLLRGRTPGKAALGLRVVRDDGGPIGFRQALVRGLAGGFLERPGVTLFLAAVVSMLLSSQSKRLGDLLAGTVVVRERVAARGGAMATMPPQLEGWAAGLDLSRLPDAVALSARQFVARADQLTDDAREDLGGRLVRAVTDAVGPPPPGTPGWAVLSAVLAERRRRELERLTAGPAPAAPLPPPAPAVPAAGDDQRAPRASGPGDFVAPG
jgi:uncharacterized RDD family membrane protein YckC